VFCGLCPALSEGDRVVVAGGPHQSKEGCIVMIRDIASGGHLVRWAKVLEQYDGVSQVRTRDVGIYVELLHLRRSTLNPPFLPFTNYQRVCVVSGTKYRGIFGRIVDFDPENPFITFTKTPFQDDEERIEEPQTEEPLGEDGRITLHMRYIARRFFRGDKIKIVRGQYKDREGYVVNLYIGGSAEIFDVGFFYSSALESRY
jgi:ribosomal protein L24